MMSKNEMDKFNKNSNNCVLYSNILLDNRANRSYTIHVNPLKDEIIG